MASLISKLWMRVCVKRASLSIMIVGLDNSGKTSVLDNLASLKQGAFSQPGHQHVGSSVTSQTSAASQSGEVNISASSLSKCDSNSSCGSNVMPTVGYNYERLQYKGLTFTVLDFSGQNRYRNLWQEFYNGVDAIVFVIDSSDLIRLVVVRDELETMLSHPYFNSLSSQQQLSSFNNLIDKSPLSAQKQLTISQGRLIQNTIEKCPSGQSLKKSNFRLRTKVPILFLANKSDLPNSVDTEVITKALNLNQLPIDRHPWIIQATSVNLNKGIVEGFDWLVSQLSVV